MRHSGVEQAGLVNETILEKVKGMWHEWLTTKMILENMGKLIDLLLSCLPNQPTVEIKFEWGEQYPLYALIFHYDLQLK